MNKKIWAGITILVISALWLSIFLSKSRKPLTVGRKLPAAERIVSLSCTTEILCALGAEDKIAAISGIDEENPYYGLLKNKPAAGGGIRNVNLEMVLGFKPDLVFCWKGHADILREKGLNVYSVGTYDVEGVMELILDVGRLAGRENGAEEIVADMRKREIKVKDKVEDINNKPLVYFEAGTVGKSRGPGCLTHNLITAAGGINIAGEERVPFPLLSQEYIIDKNPDIIIVEEYGASPGEIKKRNGWQNIKAVKNNRVYRSYTYFTSYVPRCIEGMEQFAEWFYPEKEYR
ncbi:ABC transporter substrate-binding protein [bacterium]|nr:ABC transporter substrate-binding protein [bacterium]MBU3955787.1 ABC transporter substrate-binding protein [bacterium]